MTDTNFRAQYLPEKIDLTIPPDEDADDLWQKLISPDDNYDLIPTKPLLQYGLWRRLVGEIDEEKDDDLVCRCFNVTSREIDEWVRNAQHPTAEKLTSELKAGGACTQCLPNITDSIQEISFIRQQQRDGTKPIRMPLENLSPYQAISLVDQLLQSLVLKEWGEEMVTNFTIASFDPPLIEITCPPAMRSKAIETELGEKLNLLLPWGREFTIQIVSANS